MTKPQKIEGGMEGKEMTPEEIKKEIKGLYALLGKRYRTVSERRPIEKEIKELKQLL